MPSKLKDILMPLVEHTVPHGHEASLEPLLPQGWSKDKHGNYVINVGDHGGIMFSSHLDTACKDRVKVKLRVSSEGRLHTDGSSILGADCKAGAALMIWMIEHGVPGHYVFHAGEEVGGVGSLARATDEQEWYRNNIKACIAFDRRSYHSIITRQGGDTTASEDFAKSLIAQVPSMAIDTTGSFTDSKSYAHLVPECTNLSVGYHREHTTGEWQSLPYLYWLSRKVLEIQWKDLVISRVPEESKWSHRHGSGSRSFTVLDTTQTSKTATDTTGKGSKPVDQHPKLRWEAVTPYEKTLWCQRMSVPAPYVALCERLVLNGIPTACFLVRGRSIASLLEEKKTLDRHRVISISGKPLEERLVWEKDLLAAGRLGIIKPTKREQFGYDPNLDELFLLSSNRKDIPPQSVLFWSESEKQWCALLDKTKGPTVASVTTWKEFCDYA